MKKTLVVALVVLLLRTTFAGEAPEKLARSLADFGPLTTRQQPNEAYAKALEALGRTGGLLLVPRSAAGLLRLEGPPQTLVRIPPAPAPARTWRQGPAVTTAEADADYAAFVETSWLADRAVTKKAASGFTVQFARPAPDGATLDWMIVR